MSTYQVQHCATNRWNSSGNDLHNFQINRHIVNHNGHRDTVEKV